MPASMSSTCASPGRDDWTSQSDYWSATRAIRQDILWSSKSPWSRPSCDKVVVNIIFCYQPFGCQTSTRVGNDLARARQQGAQPSEINGETRVLRVSHSLPWRRSCWKWYRDASDNNVLYCTNGTRVEDPSASLVACRRSLLPGTNTSSRFG